MALKSFLAFNNKPDLFRGWDLQKLIAILLFTFFIPQSFASDESLSEFEKQSYQLLTNRHPKMSLNVAIAILEDNIKLTQSDRKVLEEIYSLALIERHEINYHHVEYLKKSIVKQRRTVWVVPLGLVASGLLITVNPEIPMFVKLFFDGGVAAYVGHNYLPEMQQKPNSHIQQLKRQVASSILLAKIHYRLFKKDEGFPWPFVDKPSCELSLKATLSDYNLK